ncbi:MAG: transaldolase family protein [Pirellulaceae bacterium]|nr:transaldolase family protein [Pirellulaceae bacterium]
MSNSLTSLIQSGTKLWLDSIDPKLVGVAKADGATGATSNPIIVSDLLKSGRFDEEIGELISGGWDNEAIAWEMTDRLVRDAQAVFYEVWVRSQGNDGYVSFELDPLIEDPHRGLSLEQQIAAYIDLGKKWSEGHENRMIKVPATAGGLASVEELAAAGIPLNVTLIFSQRQYEAARDAVWRGAQRAQAFPRFKSVYSIFVSRVDVYTEKHVPQLGQAQGLVGIVNCQRIWAFNQAFWKNKQLPLAQEIVFASTGTKKASDLPWKYVAALAGSDIQTNPPATNRLAADSGVTFTREVDRLPGAEVLAEIDRWVDPVHLEATLMDEGLAKFAQPHQDLLALIEHKRANLVG